MRRLLVLGALLGAAAPAMAQPPVDADDGWYEEAPPVAVLTDPRAIDHAAHSIDRLVGAIMDLPVGGIAAALDPYGRVPPGATVRDLAARGDPYAEARIRDQIRGTAHAMGAMSHALGRTIPVLRRSIDEIERSLAVAIDEVDRPD